MECAIVEQHFYTTIKEHLILTIKLLPKKFRCQFGEQGKSLAFWLQYR